MQLEFAKGAVKAIVQRTLYLKSPFEIVEEADVSAPRRCGASDASVNGTSASSWFITLTRLPPASPNPSASLPTIRSRVEKQENALQQLC